MKLIEEKVKTENRRAPNRPIYLVGESIGACFALAVAARNPHLDLVLILANPGQHLKHFVLFILIFFNYLLYKLFVHGILVLKFGKYTTIK